VTVQVTGLDLEAGAGDVDRDGHTAVRDTGHQAAGCDGSREHDGCEPPPPGPSLDLVAVRVLHLGPPRKDPPESPTAHRLCGSQAEPAVEAGAKRGWTTGGSVVSRMFPCGEIGHKPRSY